MPVEDKEYFDKDDLFRFFESRKFIDTMIKSSRMTHETGCEHAFDVVRKFKSEIKVLSIKEGSPSGVSGSDELAFSLSEYLWLAAHTHPSDHMPYPSPDDLIELEKWNIVNSAFGGFYTRPIGCCAVYYPKEGNCPGDMVAVSLYQPKGGRGSFSIEDIMEKAEEAERKFMDASNQSQFKAQEVYTDFVETLIKPNYNIGVLYLLIDGEKHALSTAANSGYIPPFKKEHVTPEEVLTKFEFETQRVSKDS